MGKAEKLILATMRNERTISKAWDVSQLKSVVYPPKSPSGLRQVYRVIRRLNVLPSPITLEALLGTISEESHRSEVVQAVEKAQKQRIQISIVQLKEVRMGTWALLWNNLRLAKRWIWIGDSILDEVLLSQLVARMIGSHRSPCCLIFPFCLSTGCSGNSMSKVKLASIVLYDW